MGVKLSSGIEVDMVMIQSAVDKYSSSCQEHSRARGLYLPESSCSYVRASASLFPRIYEDDHIQLGNLGTGRLVLAACRSYESVIDNHPYPIWLAELPEVVQVCISMLSQSQARSILII